MIIFYKLLQIVIILVFALFVSDLRKKNKTKELLNHKLIIFMKVIYMVPLIIFIYSVINIRDLYISDYIGLSLTFVGLFIVILAKMSLGKNHSWTGYGTFPDSLVTSGIYSYIRHPMYVGIFVCIFGMWVHIFSHLDIYLLIVNVFSSIFILYVLLSSSKREEQHLQGIFSEDYVDYSKEVSMFLPIRIRKEYNKNSEVE